MWSCPKCTCENSDSAAQCRRCAAPRPGRHFQPPVVTKAQEEIPYRHRAQQPIRPNQSRSEMHLPPLSGAAKLLRFSGGMLLVLLPLICILLAWRQHDVLYTALVPLLTGTTDVTALGHVCYLLFALAALLLSLLPGLWALCETGKYKRPRRDDRKLL